MSRVFILTMAGVLISTLELSVPIFGQIWVTRYNGPANDYDYASAIAVDGSGNIYVTGTSWGSGSFNDYATVKYNSSGDSLWVARYNGPDNSYDEVSAVAVNRSYVYVTGGSMDSNLCYDYATSKYNSLGNSLWVARYNGPANDNDYANAIAVDGSQNVYVTGYSTGSGTWWDCATTKYDSSGVEQWVKRYITNDYDYAIAIAIDGLGNIYVTGSSGDPYTSNWDFMTIKYASSGDSQWVARYNGPADDHDEASAIAVDGLGNIYVTGGSAGLGTGWDYTTIKYASSGDSQWVARYNGSANGTDWASAIAVDSAGNIYVTGYSADSVTDCDYATVKYNSSGIEQWVARYNGPVDGYDEGKAIAIDGLGNIYVTGSSYGLATGTDYATVKYNSSGIEQWVARYNGPGNGNDYAYAITVDGSDYIYVTGESEGLGTDYDYTTIKYSCAGVEESSNSKSQIQNPNLEIYPNPFIQSTSIRYHLPAKSKISLNIYDVTGRIVRTLVNEEKETGYYSVGFNAKGLTAGIYFAKLEAVPINRDFGSASTGDYKEVKKLILMR